ncbi:MAG: hypothetical protein EPN85_00620 [Bacteroidetes bacterium]|nr:MAG: hypothetical protein EPN85_00620 [Bacteroidota bacterium]
MNKRVKKYSFIVLCIIIVLALPFLYIIVKNIQNDLPLREYVKESLLRRVKTDIHRLFTFTGKDKLKLPELFLEIDEKAFAELDSLRSSKLELLNHQGIAHNEQSQWDYVNATLVVNDTLHAIKIRIRGDMPSNYNRGLENSSYRFNVESKTSVFGKKKLSMVRPFLENNFYGYLFSHFFEKEGFISNDILFIRLYLNGKENGIYFLQEGFSKELVESSEYREGVIVRFKNDCEDNNGTYNSTGVPELDVYSEGKTLKDSSLSKNYNRALFKFEALKSGKLGPEQCFNTKKFANYFALCDFFLAHHSYVCHNVKMYFNPINDKFEPIAWDPSNFVRYKIKLHVQPGYTNYSGEIYYKKESYPIHNYLYRDTNFLKEFNRYIYLYSHNDSIRNFLQEHYELIEAIDPELYRDRFQEKFNSSLILDNIKSIKNWFTTDNRLIAKIYRNEKILVVKSVNPLPILLTALKLDPEITVTINKLLLPYSSDTIPIDSGDPDTWGRKFSLSSVIYGMDSTKMKYKGVVFEKKDNINSVLISEIPDTTILSFDKRNKVVSFRKKNTAVQKSLYIPPGYRFIILPGSSIMLTNHANIICESGIQALGTPENPIQFQSDGTGGILIKNSELNSELNYVNFYNLSAPKDGNWEITGAVTFYDCSVHIKNCSFSNNKSEDAINIVKGNFSIDSCNFSNILSDAIDIDYGKGTLANSVISNTGNDGVDISSARVTISNLQLKNIGDKGLSGGEKAIVNASNVSIDKSLIGIASKDRAIVNIKKLNVKNATYPLAAYQKKPEYGPAIITCSNFSCDNKKYLIEQNSILVLNKDTVRGAVPAVFKAIYATK